MNDVRVYAVKMAHLSAQNNKELCIVGPEE